MLYIEMIVQQQKHRDMLSYVFNVTPFPNASHPYKLVPQAWAGELNALFGSRNASYLGSISYQFYSKGKRAKLEKRPSEARTCRYYPKSGISREMQKSNLNTQAPGLPYLLEAMATADLKKRGIDFVSTSRSPSEERIKQVERAGLKRLERTEINVWLAAMGRGIRSSIRSSDWQIGKDMRNSSNLL